MVRYSIPQFVHPGHDSESVLTTPALSVGHCLRAPARERLVEHAPPEDFIVTPDSPGIPSNKVTSVEEPTPETERSMGNHFFRRTRS